MIYILHDLEDPSYGNYGMFLTMGNAGFISSTVSMSCKTRDHVSLAHDVAELKARSRRRDALWGGRRPRV